MAVMTVEAVIAVDLGSPRRYRAPAGQYYIDCPFCGGHGKLNVNLAKNVWRCAKCGEGGGALKLHKMLRNIPSDDAAYLDFNIRYGNLSAGIKNSIVEIEHNAVDVERNRMKAAPLSDRDKFYRVVIRELHLSPEHYASLRKRGLSGEAIRHNGYRTYPEEQLLFAAADAAYKSSGISLEPGFMIPGMYREKNGKLRLVPNHGILIPCRTLDGRISGFQIRNDRFKENTSSAKYIWLSSASKPSGCSFSGCENLHFAGDWSRIPSIINITEGILKADVASYLRNVPFIGVPGVSNISQLPETLRFLKKHGAEHVNICYDMDYRDKPEVKHAEEKLEMMIRASGLSCGQITWPAKYKGIDDYFFACAVARRRKTHELRNKARSEDRPGNAGSGSKR